MKTQLLTLNGKTFSIEELNHLPANDGESDFEKSTLSFCRSWLNGQKEFVIHTSGSTGTPKEIILKRSAMEQSAQMTIRALQLKSSDTSLVCLDTKYIAGQMMLVRSLIHGMDIIAVEPTANPLSNLEQSVDFTALVPYQLDTVLSESPKKLNQIRCAIVGGAAVSRSLRQKAKKSKCSLYTTYGMTETISHIALQKLNGPSSTENFETLDGVRIRTDARGCLCIQANHLGDEIVTNDLVEIIDQTKFKWLGRIDNIINSGGVKLIPERIEAALEKIFDSLHLPNRFFVAGVPDNKFGQRVVVVIEGSVIIQEVRSKILESARPALNKFETPKEFLFVPKFVETANGKINRSASLNLCLSSNSKQP
ncbi:MAG TPA: AMP-binding protein [Cyclobacteriaceae bacterium]|nr:AMP-binding protein [Cyclobacteriaceae bacterium]